jgi:uncharacterized Zn finger protein (UPF0148 family)
MPSEPDDTEIMSQYLQRGATMLGDHCDDCNNPLFRVQGEEMCVVCRARGADDDGHGGDDAAGSRGNTGTDRESEPGGAAATDAGSVDDPTDALTADEPLDAAAVDEIRRNVLGVARRVSRDARDERELDRLRDQMAVVEACVDVLDELG